MDIEKEKQAIETLRNFVPANGESYYLCYSGGKDSDAIRILAQLAGVPHEIHHNLTTVDAPETIQYIKTIPGVMIDKARYADGKPKTMWNLIPKKRMPPTRLVRWCCSELKEAGGKGRRIITGVRWDESTSRKRNHGLITITDKAKKVQKLLDDLDVDFRVTPSGGIVMNYDNETARDALDEFQQCFVTKTVSVNPIVGWSDQDVWDFLHHYGCDGNPLYQCGKRRIGCIGCPMAGGRRQKEELHRYPKFKALYISAFEKMLQVRKEEGLKVQPNWQTGEDVFRWWIGEDPDQYSMFDENELFVLMQDIRMYRTL